MFDMTSETAPHLPGGNRSTVLLSSALHAIVLAALVIVPALFASDHLPDVSSMAAFVVTAPPVAPPPPVAAAPSIVHAGDDFANLLRGAGIPGESLAPEVLAEFGQVLRSVARRAQRPNLRN